MKPNVLVECFDMTLKALDKSIEFITDNNVSAPDRMDYINYLTGYFVYNPEPTEEQMAGLVEWYENVDFNNKSNSKRRTIFTQMLNM